MDVELYIAEDGLVSCVYQDEVADALKEIGRLVNIRASHVEPLSAAPSRWGVDVAPILGLFPPLSGVFLGNGIYRGVFDSRAEALKFETEWLNRYLTTRRFE